MTTPTVASSSEGRDTDLNSSGLTFIMLSKRSGGRTSPTKRPPPISWL